ncbi:MAG: dephospho-CoA kinase, partial [Melioribacter sp.]|nr:dephospho-CoA kinase [Melioribacter sp.]
MAIFKNSFNKMKKKLLIGITGGIGAGKSIVSSILESMGYCVLKSDLVAKEIMQNGCKGFIQKPFSMIELSRKVRRTLHKK